MPERPLNAIYGCRLHPTANHFERDGLICCSECEAQLRQGAGPGPKCPKCGGQSFWVHVNLTYCAKDACKYEGQTGEFFPSQERWV